MSGFMSSFSSPSVVFLLSVWIVMLRKSSRGHVVFSSRRASLGFSAKKKVTDSSIVRLKSGNTASEEASPRKLGIKYKECERWDMVILELYITLGGMDSVCFHAW